MIGWKRLGLRDLDCEYIQQGNSKIAEGLVPEFQRDCATSSTPVRDVDSSSSTCVTCGTSFPGFREQREHFRSEWHQRNVQRRVRKKRALSEQESEYLSNISSASESEDDESRNEKLAREGEIKPGTSPRSRSLKVEFEDPTGSGGFLVLWRCALPDFQTLKSLKSLGIWVIILCGGGHFAGVVYDAGGEILTHQSIHRYTTRKQQGRSQSAADSSRGGGSKARSAGATLRRYSEELLRKEARETIVRWRDWIVRAQAVYIQASGRVNRGILYGFAESPLNGLGDGVLRRIPFSIKRPTFSEAKRAFVELSTVIRAPESQMPVMGELKTVVRRKSSISVKATSDKGLISPNVKGTDHLKKRNVRPRKNDVRDVQPTERNIMRRVDENLASVYDACCSGEVALMKEALSKYRQSVNPIDPLNHAYHSGYGSKKSELSGVDKDLSLVAVAAILGEVELLRWLLDAGADPTVGAQPYALTRNKKARITLRRYWAENPERYDYAAAGIPSKLTPEMEARQNQKERDKRKREKGRKKEKLRKVKQEEEERKKPKYVNERERRAVAAEARIRKMKESGVNCDKCGISLNGITPFERLRYKYCTVACVQAHRNELL